MKRLLPWILNLIIVVVALFLLFGRDDDESQASTPEKVEATTTTTEPPPAVEDYIAEGALRETLLERLERDGASDIDLSAWDSDDWELGEVRDIKGGAMSIRGGDGVVLIYAASGCSDSNDELLPSYFGALFNPGDWALWNTAGGDTRVCDGEIALVWEG